MLLGWRPSYSETKKHEKEEMSNSLLVVGWRQIRIQDLLSKSEAQELMARHEVVVGCCRSPFLVIAMASNLLAMVSNLIDCEILLLFKIEVYCPQCLS